jgi:ABC-2 type transport system ATP-binding protein
MSAAIVVKKAYKIYKNLSASLWNRSSSSNSASRFGSPVEAGASRISGLLDQMPVVVAVDRVSFTVNEGQIFGLIGPNGSGKSTLIRLLATLLSLDDGAIQIFGFDSARQPLQIQRLINPVAAEASFFKKLSPMDNLVQDGRQYGIDERETRRQVMDILTHLGMQERFILSPMEEISAGMQQMVTLARAILARPRLLLLDEPSSGLGPFAKRQMHALLRNLRQHLGTTVVFATQDIDEADVLCDTVAILDRGQIVALDSPKALRGSPAISLEDVFLELTQRQPFALEAEIV